MSYFPSIVFSDFLHGVGLSEMINNSGARFLKKDLIFQKFWKKYQKVAKIEVFSIFLKNGSNDFWDFLCEVRSDPFLPCGENRMSRKNHLLEIMRLESRAGTVSGPIGRVFKRLYLGKEEAIWNLIRFSESWRTKFCPRFKSFYPYFYP